MEKAAPASTDVSMDVSIRDLLDAGLHFGHQTKRWNPKMKRYIFGKRNGIHIIDLSKSLALLNIARKFASDIVGNGQKILMVGTKKQAQKTIEEAAVRTGQYYVTNRWLGGTLTNIATLRKSVKRMRDIEKMDTDGSFDKMSKKEVSWLKTELTKLRKNLSGTAEMAHLPGAVFVSDVASEAIAVAEANRLQIPVIAIVDTNCDPDPINYPIPGNDDSIRATKVVVDALAAAIEQANREYAVRAVEINRRKQAEAVAAAAAREKAAASAPSGIKTDETSGAGADKKRTRAPRRKTDGAASFRPAGARSPRKRTSDKPAASKKAESPAGGVETPPAAPAAQPESAPQSN